MADDSESLVALIAPGQILALSQSEIGLIARGRRELMELAQEADAMLRAKDRAELGDPAAQYELCWLLSRQGAESEADMWLRRAAEQGYSKAQYCIGILLFVNSTFGWESHQIGQAEEAVCWLRKAAKQGHPWAQYAYATALEEGRGVAPDAIEAAIWYKRATEQGVTTLVGGLEP
jgi:TPR repeat protein